MPKTDGKKTCYYELMGVDRKCDAAEIKTQYRKLALRMHPDKAALNGLTIEQATSKFQEIQEAHSVLSDPQERAWYDAHREQILRGEDDGEMTDPFKTRINLYKYFSTSCFNGFADDANGFYAVYADVFAAIDSEEADWEDLDSDEEHVAMPPFGDSKTDGLDVSRFYKHWLDFCSRKAFGHADKWNLKEAPNRHVRRAMEAENKKSRQGAKKEFNAEVRQLVTFVQKRDPRVQARQRQQLKEKAEKKEREVAEQERRKKKDAEERRQRREEARLEEEARWEAVQTDRAARRMRGEAVTESEDESENEAEIFVCEACNKTFKSEKAYEQHEKSKKHLQVVEALRKQMELEMLAEMEAEQSSASDDLDCQEEEGEEEENEESEWDCDHCTSHTRSRKKSEVRDENSDDDESDDENVFLARFAGKKRGVQRGRISSAESHSTCEKAGNNDPTPAGTEGAGKRTQKKSQQLLALLEQQKKKAQEKADKLEKQAPKMEEAAQAEKDEESVSESRCGVCGQNFPSRTKLFQHIKSSGHAMLKEVAPPVPCKGKKKKR